MTPVLILSLNMTEASSWFFVPNYFHWIYWAFIVRDDGFVFIILFSLFIYLSFASWCQSSPSLPQSKAKQISREKEEKERKEKGRRGKSCYGRCNVIQWVTLQTPLSMYFDKQVFIEKSHWFGLWTLVFVAPSTLGPQLGPTGMPQLRHPIAALCLGDSAGPTTLCICSSRPEMS